jgi:transposase
MNRRTYHVAKIVSTQFKSQTVHLVLSEGLPVQTVEMKLEIHANSLYRWILEYGKYGERAFPGKGSKEFIQQKKSSSLRMKIKSSSKNMNY